MQIICRPQAQCKHTSLAWLACYAKSASKRLHNSLHNREPEAATANLGRHNACAPIKGIANVCQLCGFDSDSMIRNTDGKLSAKSGGFLRIHLNTNPPTLATVFRCILKQVLHAAEYSL